MPRTLYICYFGLREPLVQTQVVPYLREIAKGGMEVELLTFEPELSKKWSDEQLKSAADDMAAKKIKWECLAYHKRPSAIATAYDIFVGTRFIRRKMRKQKIDILHGRIHVGTLMGALARKFSTTKPKVIFDIRGFFPEEYTEAGVWPANGWLYRAAKRVERWLMREADAFVVLTEKAKDLLFKNEVRPVEVIPCCVDLETRFATDNETARAEIETRLGTKDRFVVAHVGALGGLYLTNEIVDLIDAARSVDPSTFALFLTQSDPTSLSARLKEKGFTERDLFIGQVDPNEIPMYLSIADVGISFVKATYATQSRSPTKIPEYLACGLPLIANSGVGDVGRLITEEGVGILIDKFDRETYVDAITRLKGLGDISEKCRNVAKSRFDLETVGGVRYRRLYDRLLKRSAQ